MKADRQDKQQAAVRTHLSKTGPNYRGEHFLTSGSFIVNLLYREENYCTVEFVKP